MGNWVRIELRIIWQQVSKSNDIDNIGKNISVSCPEIPFWFCDEALNCGECAQVVAGGGAHGPAHTGSLEWAQAATCIHPHPVGGTHPLLILVCLEWHFYVYYKYYVNQEENNSIL